MEQEMKRIILTIALLLAVSVWASDSPYHAKEGGIKQITLDGAVGDCVYVALGDLRDTGMGLFSFFAGFDSLKASTVIDSLNFRYRLATGLIAGTSGAVFDSSCIWVPGAVSNWLWVQYRVPGGTWTNLDSVNTTTAIIPLNRATPGGWLQFRLPDLDGYAIPGVMLWLDQSGGSANDSIRINLRTDTD